MVFKIFYGKDVKTNNPLFKQCNKTLQQYDMLPSNRIVYHHCYAVPLNLLLDRPTVGTITWKFLFVNSMEQCGLNC